MKKILFIMLILIVVVSTIFVFFFLSDNKRSITPEPVNNPSPSVVPVNTGAPTLPPINNVPILNKNSLIDLLPYSTNDFDIEYLTTSDTFVVTVKNSPYEANKEQANAWLKEKGVEDPGKLRIMYTKYRWVQ